MVQVDAKIVMCGMICLTVMFLFLLAYDKLSEMMGMGIIGIIGLGIGVLIPTPTIDNKSGVLKW